MKTTSIRIETYTATRSNRSATSSRLIDWCIFILLSREIDGALYFGRIRTRLRVDHFPSFPRKFAACSKPPSRDNYRKASYPRTQQRDQGGGWSYDPAIRVVVKTTPLHIRPRCRYLAFCIFNIWSLMWPDCWVYTELSHFSKRGRVQPLPKTFTARKICWNCRCLKLQALHMNTVEFFSSFALSSNAWLHAGWSLITTQKNATNCQKINERRNQIL